MARTLTAASAPGAAVLHLHTQLLAGENADGSWPGAYAVRVLDEIFQRVGLHSCDGCGAAAGQECHPNCLSTSTGHDRSEGAPA